MAKLNIPTELATIAADIFAPRPLLNPWQWNEAHVYIPIQTGTEIPGQYSSAWCPYVREPMEDFLLPDVHVQVFCWASQTCKTETVFGILRYEIGNDRVPITVFLPSTTLARSVSSKRFDPVVDATPALRALKPENSDHYTLMEKHFKTCSVRFSGTGGAAQTASWSLGVVIADEVDKMRGQTRKEASALLLALERTKARFYKKHIITSTPTVESGEIWGQFIIGDQRFYFVPCPHCGFEQPLDFGNVKWPEDAKENGRWNLARIEKEAWYECANPACAQKILNHHKPAMLRAGKWRATEKFPLPEGKSRDPKRRSYHISSLYPANLSFGTVAVEFLKAKDDANALQNFVNSWLAQPFFRYGADRDFEKKIKALAQDAAIGAPDQIPAGYKVIVTIDVQQWNLFVRVRCWNANGDSLGLEWANVPGFAEAELLAKKWKAVCVFVDSGYAARNNEVLNECAARAGWYPVRGTGTLYINLRWSEAPIEGGLFKGQSIKILQIRPDPWKELLWQRINRVGTPDQLLTLPAWKNEPRLPQDYVDGMLGEARIEKKDKRGRTTIEYIKISHNNHPWDCEVYSLAAHAALRSIIFEPESSPPKLPPAPTAETVGAQSPAPAPPSDDSRPPPRPREDEGNDRNKLKW